MTPLEVIMQRPLTQETKTRSTQQLYIKKETNQLRPLTQLQPQRVLQELTPPKQGT